MTIEAAKTRTLVALVVAKQNDPANLRSWHLKSFK